MMMKNLLLFAAVVLAACSALDARSQTPLVQEISQSADEVWEEIRKMDNIDEISSFVSKVDWTGPKGEGGQRVCTAADGKGRFKEQITSFDDASRSYFYKVVEGVPAKNMNNTVKVVDLGFNRCMIVWTTDFEFIENPNMTLEQFDAFLASARSEMVENIIKANS